MDKSTTYTTDGTALGTVDGKPALTEKGFPKNAKLDAGTGLPQGETYGTYQYPSTWISYSTISLGFGLVPVLRRSRLPSVATRTQDRVWSASLVGWREPMVIWLDEGSPWDTTHAASLDGQVFSLRQRPAL